MKENDTNFIVYAHYTKDTNELFYIGEGRPERAKSTRHRNRWWRNKVKKHGGFNIQVLKENLTKEEAQKEEENLILDYKNKNVQLVNILNGPMFKGHWLLNAPKEIHPMYGKKRPDSSKRMTEWNLENRGEKHPNYGRPSPKTIERNKNGVFKRFSKKIKCIELNMEFESLQSARRFLNKPGINLCRALKDGTTAGGYHWEYMNTAKES